MIHQCLNRFRTNLIWVTTKPKLFSLKISQRKSTFSLKGQIRLVLIGVSAEKHVQPLHRDEALRPGSGSPPGQFRSAFRSLATEGKHRMKRKPEWDIEGGV